MKERPQRPLLAANLSRELLALAADGRVTVDAVKVPSLPGVAERDAEIALAEEHGLPVILHFWGQPFNAGSPDLMDRLDLDDLAAVVERTKARSLQTHLYITPDDVPGIASPDRQTPLERASLIEIASDNVAGLMGWSGLEVRIENGIHWGIRVRPNRPGSFRCVVEPDFISEVVGNTGCGFLLDVAHARVAAHYLGVPFGQYLAALPLEAVREIHVNRPAWVDGVWRDSHLGLEPEDLPSLEVALAGTSPDIVTYEYGSMDPDRPDRSEKQPLAAGLELIRQLLSSH